MICQGSGNASIAEMTKVEIRRGGFSQVREIDVAVAMKQLVAHSAYAAPIERIFSAVAGETSRAASPMMPTR
jgi:hypothetical protein